MARRLQYQGGNQRFTFLRNSRSCKISERSIWSSSRQQTQLLTRLRKFIARGGPWGRTDVIVVDEFIDGQFCPAILDLAQQLEVKVTFLWLQLSFQECYLNIISSDVDDEAKDRDIRELVWVNKNWTDIVLYKYDQAKCMIVYNSDTLDLTLDKILQLKK